MAIARRRLPGLRVRPGSVRTARQEAGLSLAGVARDDVSRTAIFLIETGKSNPTLPTLELISERTGKPVDYFLDDEAPQAVGAAIDFLHIEQLLASEDFEAVKKITGELLASRCSRADTAKLKYLKGVAHIRRADAEAAEPLLRDAREYYESIGDRTSAVECLSFEVNVPIILEDPGALQFAEEALRRCRQLAPVPASIEARILGRLAVIHSFHRNWTEAVHIFEQVVELYGSMRDMSRMAHVYCDLGNAYREMGQPELAARYSQKSIAIHEMLRDSFSTAMAENNLGLALLKLNNYSGAEEHLERSLSLLEEGGRERGKSHVLLSLAELHVSKGSLEEAEQFAAEGLNLARSLGESATEAEAWKWLGIVAAADSNQAECDRRFEVAFGLLEDLNMGERLIQAHAAYAEILEERGEMQAANGHLRKVLGMSRPDLISNRRERAEESMLA